MGKDDIVFLPSKEVVINTIKKFQTDSSLQWIFFAYQESDPSTKLAKGNSNTIELARSGNEPLDRNQLENLRDVTKDEESIKAYLSPHSANYFIARIDANRYIFINWIGTKTKTLQKTRVMTHRLELKSMAEKLLSMSFVFDHNGIDEFDKLVNIVDSSRSFEFENMKDQKQSVSSPRQSSQVASASASLKSASTSASTTNTTTTSSSSNSSSSSTNVGNNSATKGSLMNRYNPQTLTEQEQINARRHQRSGSKPPKLGLAAIMRQVLKLDESNITPLLKQRSFGWLLLGYNADGLCQVEGQGNDQCTFPDPLFDALKEDDMQYIVLRWVLSNTGYGGDVEKTYFLSYVGSAVNSVRRGKVNQHKQEVYDYVNKHFQLGGEVTITALEELNVDYIKNVMLGNRSANTVTLTDWGTVPVKASPVTATTTQAKPISSPLSSPRNTKKETTTTATVATSSVTTDAPEKPIERKGSELLSKIKLGFKDGRLKGIKGTTPEPAEDLTSPKNMKSPGRGETLKSPGRDGLTSPGRRKSTKGGILSFSANNMDKFSTSLKKKDVVKVSALGTGQNAIKIDDETKVIDKLYELKDPLDRNNQWVLFSYPNDKTLNVLSLVDSGSEPVASSVAVTSHLTDSSVKFFIHKFYVERNSRIEAKFRVIIWRGKSIRAYFKAICTNHAMKLATTIAPVITQVEGDPIILADVADVSKLVLPLEGFGTPLDHNDAIKKLEEKLAAAEQREKQKDSSSPSNKIHHEKRVSMKKADYNAGIEAGLKILNEEDLIQKMKDLQSDDSDVSWITISYKDSKTLQLDGSGSGTAESFKSKLTDDKVYYILYKQFLDELGGAPKTILIAWVGQDVKPMAKASTTPHRIALFKYCLRHVTLSSEYQPIGINDLDNDSIFGKVSGGSKSGSSGVLSKSFGGKSQSLTLVEDSVILENVKDLNSDATATNWVKLGYNENGHLRYEEKGQGGLAEFERRLSDDSVNYVLYKTYVEHSPKITLITWVGSGVTAGTAKARATTHQLELEGFVKKVFTVAALYQALEREELKEELIYKKVAGSNIIVAPTAVSKGTFGGRDSSLKFESDQAVLDAFKELRGNSGIRWLLFEYVPGNQYTVRVAQMGKGGVRNFKQYLTDNVVAYVVMRLTFMEYSDVAKAIVITWVGENAQSFQKALSGGHRINLYEYTKKQISVGGEYQPESLDSLSDEDLLSKITGTKSDNAGDALEEKIQQQRTFERERIVQVQPTIEVKDSKQYIGEFKDIEFGGKGEIKKALLDLSEKCRKEQHDRALEDATIHYVKMKLTGKELRDVVIETTGDGALTEEWRAANLNSNECLLFIFGLFTSEGGYGMMTKYVFVQWIGHDTKHLLKAKASEIRQSIYNFCNKELNMSGEIQGCTKPEHVTKKLVLEKITGSNVRGSEMQLAKKDKKFEGLGKEKKSKLVIKDQEKLNHYVEDMILQDYLEKDDKKDDDDPEEWRNHKRITQGKLDWILMSYDKDSIDEIHVSAYGEGDVESFKQHLKPDSVNFVIIRVFHAQGYAKDISMLTDNRINLAKPYFTLIYWKGENVQILEKALTSHHFNAFHKLMTQKFMRMKSSLQGSTYQAENYEELDMERIKKLMRLYD